MEHVPRLEERYVEGPAVVGHERTTGVEAFAHDAEQRALERMADHEELLNAERGPLEPRAADQKGVRAGAAGQARRFEVQEQERAALLIVGRRLPSPGQQRERRPGRVEVGRRWTYGQQSVAMVLRIAALNHDTGAERRRENLASERPRRRVREPIAHSLRRRVRARRVDVVAVCIPGSLPGRRTELGARRNGGELPEPVGELRGHAAAPPATRLSRIASATCLASGPLSPTGPTQVGHP